jgi:hypothetical protein
LPQNYIISGKNRYVSMGYMYYICMCLGYVECNTGIDDCENVYDIFRSIKSGKFFWPAEWLSAS